MIARVRLPWKQMHCLTSCQSCPPCLSLFAVSALFVVVIGVFALSMLQFPNRGDRFVDCFILSPKTASENHKNRFEGVTMLCNFYRGREQAKKVQCPHGFKSATQPQSIGKAVTNRGTIFQTQQKPKTMRAVSYTMSRS